MSSIGKAPVEVPGGVNVEISERLVKVNGPRGELSVPVGRGVEVKQENGSLVLTRASESPEHKAMHGLTRSLIQNAVTGVTEGFSKTLQIAGVGYRAALQGQNINLQVGYSHPVTVSPREGIEFEVPNATTIIVRGIDKQRVGQMAAEIREVRPPEPYKGKGIRYSDEQIRRKVGKAG
jgi:large subunit ribosomal protein L6